MTTTQPLLIMSNAQSYAKLVEIPTAIATKGVVSVLGVVVDALGLHKTGGSSSCITFTLKDSDLENGHVWDGLKIRYFRDNDIQLPSVQQGDVVLLRNISVRPVNVKGSRQLMGVAAQDKTIPWAIFRHDPDPTSSVAPMTGPTPFEPSFTEKRLALTLLERCIKIKKFRNSSSKPIASQSHSIPVASTPTRGDCFTLVKDAKYGTYVDLIGEVVKLYPPNFDNKVLIYITDYTSNRNLPDHDNDDETGQEGDYYNYQRNNRKKWTGPPGQLSLAVTIWEPHADYVREHVSEGDLVHLSNVGIKKSSINLTMEAGIHADKYDTKRRKVRLITDKGDNRVREFLHRKKEYLLKNPPKRKIAEDDEPPARSKRSKRQQKQNAEAKKDESQTAIAFRERTAANPNIVAAYGACSNRLIEDIITNESHNNVSPQGVEYRFPFQNLCYRTLARVVDFFPHALEDFAVPESQTDGSASDDERQQATGEPPSGWEWRFCLLIESPFAPAPGQTKEQMKLFVPNTEAVYLLGIDASDLHNKPDDLARLREKLFHLWGDLEELKSRAAGQAPDAKDIKSTPFHCCIQEYGVKCSHRVAASSDRGSNDDEDSSCSHDGCFGWERRFAMFMTHIR